MPNITTVRLSRGDRQLLRDVVDAIRSLKPEEEVPEGKVRLVEDWPPPAEKDPDAFYNVNKAPPLVFDSRPKEQLLEGQYRDADGRLRREGSSW